MTKRRPYDLSAHTNVYSSPVDDEWRRFRAEFGTPERDTTWRSDASRRSGRSEDPQHEGAKTGS